MLVSNEIVKSLLYHFFAMEVKYAGKLHEEIS